MKILFFSILTVIAITGIFTLSYAESDTSEIPSWIKVIAGAWVDDEIDDGTFAEAMKFLIETGIIYIDNPFSMSEVEESAQTASMQGMIDGLNTQVKDLETENVTLSRDNDSRMTAEHAQIIEAEKEQFRQNWMEESRKNSALQIKYEIVKSELESLKQN